VALTPREGQAAFPLPPWRGEVGWGGDGRERGTFRRSGSRHHHPPPSPPESPLCSAYLRQGRGGYMALTSREGQAAFPLPPLAGGGRVGGDGRERGTFRRSGSRHHHPPPSPPRSLRFAPLTSVKGGASSFSPPPPWRGEVGWGGMVGSAVHPDEAVVGTITLPPWRGEVGWGMTKSAIHRHEAKKSWSVPNFPAGQNHFFP